MEVESAFDILARIAFIPPMLQSIFIVKILPGFIYRITAKESVWLKIKFVSK